MDQTSDNRSALRLFCLHGRASLPRAAGLPHSAHEQIPIFAAADDATRKCYIPRLFRINQTPRNHPQQLKLKQVAAY
jgi:hypothetical protein